MNRINFDQYLRNWVASPESETKILSHTYADIHVGQRIDLLVDHDVDQNTKTNQLTYCFSLCLTGNLEMKIEHEA